MANLQRSLHIISCASHRNFLQESWARSLLRNEKPLKSIPFPVAGSSRNTTMNPGTLGLSGSWSGVWWKLRKHEIDLKILFLRSNKVGDNASDTKSRGQVDKTVVANHRISFGEHQLSRVRRDTE
jgi:hypothetical protein